MKSSPRGEDLGEGGRPTNISIVFHRKETPQFFYVITASRASWLKGHGSNQRNASR
jgi:hypothetical protein